VPLSSHPKSLAPLPHPTRMRFPPPTPFQKSLPHLAPGLTLIETTVSGQELPSARGVCRAFLVPLRPPSSSVGGYRPFRAFIWANQRQRGFGSCDTQHEIRYPRDPRPHHRRGLPRTVANSDPGPGPRPRIPWRRWAKTGQAPTSSQLRVFRWSFRGRSTPGLSRVRWPSFIRLER